MQVKHIQCLEQKSIYFNEFFFNILFFLYRNPGLISHILTSIFSLLEQHKGEVEYSNISIVVSFIEIYNDRIYDLLVPPPTETWLNRPFLKLFTTKDGKPLLSGLKVYYIIISCSFSCSCSFRCFLFIFYLYLCRKLK